MIKKIHQLSKDHNLSNDEIKCQSLLIKHNPDFEYKLWTDEELEKIIHKHPGLQNAWNELVGIQKADLGRYLVLYLEGGFYCDTDFFVSDGFEKLYITEDVYFAPSVRDFIFMDSGITNYFIYSNPKQQLFIDLIDESLKRRTLYNKNTIGYISNTTGKNLISFVLKNSNYNIQRFEETQIINKYCENTNVDDAFGYHNGSTSRDDKSKSWIDSNVLTIMENECNLREQLYISGNICQLPIVLITLALFLIIALVLIMRRFI